VNIAFISPEIYPCITGGVEIFNYYLIKELATQGHKIWVITCCDYDWKYENVFNIKLWRRLLLFVGPSITFLILLKLKKFKQQIDVVHVPYTSNSVLVYSILLAKKLFGIRFVISIHGGAMYPWFPKALHRHFFQQADAIVAVSKTIKEEYELRCDKKIKVIFPLNPFIKSKIPKNELRNKYGFCDSDTIILSLGSIKRIKGSDILLHAFLKLGKEYVEKNNLKLLYVGDGPMKPSLEKTVEKKSFKGYVKFYGSIPHEKVSEIYKLGNIYVISSLFEGTPKSLIEAMFNGLSVIGSDTNGINNIIINKKNGLLFEVSNEKELSIRLKEIIENEKLRDKLSKNAIKFVREKYDYNKTVSEFIQVYKDIAKKN